MTANALHPHTVAVSAGRPAAVPGGPLNVPIVPALALLSCRVDRVKRQVT
jgi:hypothetical protein